jgi:hypothetical protein
MAPLLLILIVGVISCGNRRSNKAADILYGSVEALPSVYLSDIDNAQMREASFDVTIVEENPPTPLQPLVYGVIYTNKSGKLFGNAHLLDYSQSYSCEFDSSYKADFIDLIAYIQNEPDFFDYDEFVGAPPGGINIPVSRELSFYVRVSHHGSAPPDDGIAEFVAPEEPVPPELQHVVDIMRNVFLPEILDNPYSNQPQPPDSPSFTEMQ